MSGKDNQKFLGEIRGFDVRLDVDIWFKRQEKRIKKSNIPEKIIKKRFLPIFKFHFLQASSLQFQKEEKKNPPTLKF